MSGEAINRRVKTTVLTQAEGLLGAVNLRSLNAVNLHLLDALRSAPVHFLVVTVHSCIILLNITLLNIHIFTSSTSSTAC